MILVLIVCLVLVYIFIGIALVGIQYGYIDGDVCDDLGTILILISVWPLVITALALYYVAVKPFEFFRTIGNKIRIRKGD